MLIEQFGFVHIAHMPGIGNDYQLAAFVSLSPNGSFFTDITCFYSFDT